MVIDRYIARNVLLGSLASFLVFASLFAFVDFVTELREVGTANYGTLQAIYYVMLTLPQRLYELSPTMILLGGLLSLGAMASHSELVVMRASGISSQRIIRSVLMIGLLLSCLIAATGELFIPKAVVYAKTMRTDALERGVRIGGEQGLWVKNKSLYVNVGKVLPGLDLRRVNIYKVGEDGQLLEINRVKRAVYTRGEWKLQKISRTRFTTNGTMTEKVKRETWPDLINPETFDVLKLNPEDMSARNLWSYINYLESNELDTATFKLAFWVKVFTPVTCLVMLLIAVPFAFGASARSGGVGLRIVVGLVFGILFYIINRTSNHIGLVYNIEPVLSALAPLLIMSIIGLIMLRRVQ